MTYHDPKRHLKPRDGTFRIDVLDEMIESLAQQQQQQQQERGPKII